MGDPEKKDEHAPHGHGPAGAVNAFAHEQMQRVRHILRPSDGKKIHIAGSPHEVDGLRRKLSQVNPREDEWDIVIHGSLEHVNALREAHTHQESLRNELREKHGEEFDNFERVIKELDRLGDELHMVSEHAVNLDANFSKYGYSAHLRTLPRSGETSEAVSLHENHHSTDHAARDWDAERTQGDHMVFWKRPVMRQYLHKGLLWRASDATEVASYELFIDLLYVGILAISGDGAVEEANGESLLRFAITFTMSWKLWSDISQAISWISSDDIIRRLSVLFFLTLLLGLTTNMVDSLDHTYKPLVAFYIGSRWFCGLYFFWLAYLIPMVRNAMIGSGLFCIVPAALWIGSIYLEVPQRQALIWLALPLDIFGPAILVIIERGGPWMGKKLDAWTKRTFEFMPGNAIEHKIERTNAFVALVFGYSVVALLYQSAVPFGINAFFGKAVLGLIQSFTFNWLYFEVDSFNMHTHAIRRHFFSAFVWLSSHLPFVMAFTLSGAALAKLVLAHDTTEAHPDDLHEPYSGRSEAEVSDGLAWIYCGGLSIALACMGIIAATHRTKTIVGARMPKTYRLAVRFVVALAILLLPLAVREHRLSSLSLVATTTSLVVLVLLVDLAGSTCPGDAFWGFRDRRKCTYSASARMSKKELREKIKNGETLNVEELARKCNRKGVMNDNLVV